MFQTWDILSFRLKWYKKNTQLKKKKAQYEMFKENNLHSQNRILYIFFSVNTVKQALI